MGFVEEDAQENDGVCEDSSEIGKLRATVLAARMPAAVEMALPIISVPL